MLFNSRTLCKKIGVVSSLVIGVCIAVSPASAQTYFDGLRDMPETILFRAYDNQAEINADIFAINPENRNIPPVYDPVQNAAHWVTSDGAISIGDQLRPKFTRVSQGNLLLVWETRWGAGFTGNLGALRTHKAFQLSNGKNRITEIRTRFEFSSGSDVALIDARGYSPWSPSGQPLPGQTNSFAIQPENWTRFWTFVDFDNRQLSMWVADEDSAPVQLFDKLQYSSMSGGLDNFWFEFNTSQSGPAGLNIWARNLAVLRDVADVVGIVFDGALVRSAPIADLIAE